ncbi:SDR family oxidoreductase [Streptomyces sp. NPDC049936]|uniref:SDR family oxidoreductase n=1 Tax=Streptomyces sp. NPDC049936 TaxID=3365599 RepID=UPI0037AFB810
MISVLSTGPDLANRRVLVPGGTGGVGEGIVRRFLAAGAVVVVPTRSEQRAEEFRKALGDTATGRLHLLVRGYASFEGAERLAAEVDRAFGGIDDVVAPIGGFWAGRRLWEIDEGDWRSAFVEPATAHLAVMRAFLPRMSATGAYSVLVGESADEPVPGSGLISMEQAALSMMQEVLAAEGAAGKRVFALILGPVRTRFAPGDHLDRVSAEQVGEAAVALSSGSLGGGRLYLRNQSEFAEAMAVSRDSPAQEPVVAVNTMTPKPGRRDDLLALLGELARHIRSEQGCLHYSAHPARSDADGSVLVLMAFDSIDAFEAHSTGIADQLPRLGDLLDGPPSPPTLFGGDGTASAHGASAVHLSFSG